MLIINQKEHTNMGKKIPIILSLFAITLFGLTPSALTASTSGAHSADSVNDGIYSSALAQSTTSNGNGDMNGDNGDMNGELSPVQVSAACQDNFGIITATNPNDDAVQVNVSGPNTNRSEVVPGNSSVSFAGLPNGTFTVTTREVENGVIGEQTVQINCPAQPDVGGVVEVFPIQAVDAGMGGTGNGSGTSSGAVAALAELGVLAVIAGGLLVRQRKYNLN